MRQTTGIIILESLTGLVLLIGLIFGLIAWRLVSGPTDLSFVKSDVESAFAEVRGGQPVSIEKLTLRWQAEKSEFQIYAENLKFFSTDNVIVARSENAIIDVNGLSLLTGDISLQGIEIEKGELSFERDSEGQIWIAGQMIPPVRPIQFHEASTPLQYVEQSLLNIVDNISRSAVVGKLEHVELSDFRIHVLDRPLGLTWTLEEASLRLARDNSVIHIETEGEAVGDGAPDRVVISAQLYPDRQEFDANVNLIRLRPLDFSFLKAYPGEVSGQMLADVSVAFGVEQTGVESLSVNALTEPGRLELDGEVVEFGVNDVSLIYRFAQNDLILDWRNMNAGPVSGSVNIELDEAARLIETPEKAPFDIRISAADLGVDIQPMFQDAWTLDQLNLTGLLDLAKRDLTYSYALAQKDNVRVTSRGWLYLAGDKQHHRDLPFGVELTAQSEDVISPEQILVFWPVKLGGGARNWVIENIHAGELSDIRFRFDLKPEGLRDEYLKNEDLELDFAFRNAEVSFLSDLPSILNGAGQAKLRGNSFSLDLVSGNFSNWALSDGLVGLEKFGPDTSPLSLSVEGMGSVTEMLRTLSNSRLQLENAYGLDVSAITGKGQASFSLRRPVRDVVSYDETIFNVSGLVSEGAFKNLFDDISLSDTQAKLQVSNTALQLSGYGQLEGAPVEFDWKDKFTSKAADRTTLLASGYVSPDLLNRFGIAVRTYMSGDAFARVEAKGPNPAKYDSISVKLDLAETRLDFSDFGWFKEKMAPASADILFRGLENQRRAAVRFESDDVKLDGEVTLTSAGLVDRLILGRLYMRDQIDVQGELIRQGDNGLEIEVSGPYLNAVPFIDGMFGSDGAMPIFGQINFSAKIEELKLRKQFSAENADLNLVFDGPKLKQADLSGDISGSGGFSLNVVEGAESERIISASASNAGALVSGVLGSDFVRGGVLDVSGVLRNGGAPNDLEIKLINARLVEAPLLTQILSLASLRGLTDVMSGEGILFSEVTVPLVMDASGFYVSGAKASGPALGLTAKGYMKDGGRDLSFDGVLVPSFGVNSVLGGIPIIGDLFVSRDGEGVFAMTYSVRGSLESARVAVNPLSGIVPGVLRRIFENPESEAIPTPEAAPTQ